VCVYWKQYKITTIKVNTQPFFLLIKPKQMDTKNVKHIPARITAEDGSRENSSHRFSVDKEISEKEAIELQMKLGYHPAGYGFYSFNVVDGKTYWKCSHSCD